MDPQGEIETMQLRLGLEPTVIFFFFFGYMHSTLMIFIVPCVTSGEKEINLEMLWNAFLFIYLFNIFIGV